jgi:hypothetical protein
MGRSNGPQRTKRRNPQHRRAITLAGSSSVLFNVDAAYQRAGNVPGRWHFQEYGKSEACILVGEGFNSGLAISDVPNNVMISVTLLRGRRPVDRDDVLGTLVAVTPNSLRRSLEMTIPFGRLESDTRGNRVVATYGAAITRNEVQKVLGLIKTASGDTDGSLLFRYGGIEERFLASASKNEVAAMQACMDKR